VIARAAAASALCSVALAASCTIMNGLTLDPPSDYAALVLAAGPIAYYRLDETSGSTARDSSGNGHDCTYVGDVTPGVPGLVAGNAATRFDGGLLACGTTAFAFQGSNNFTIEGWFLPDVVDARYQFAFARIQSTPHVGYAAHFHGQPAPMFDFEVYSANSEGGLSSYVSGVPLPCGEGDAMATDAGVACSRPFHLAVVYEDKKLSAWVDGARVGSNACSGLPSLAGVEFAVAGHSSANCPDCALHGVVDELAIYGRALAPEELAAHARR
jgi:hypothetical protein